MPSRDRQPEYAVARIKLGYRCNNDCLFCECRSRRDLPPVGKRKLAEKIQLAGRLGFKRVVFTGGEPTLNPDLPHLVALTRRLGMDCGLISNGRALADRAFTERLVREGLGRVQLSLHGATAAGHDLHSGTAAFGETWQALEILHELGVKLLLNCVVTRHNLDELQAIAERLEPFAPLTFKASFIEPRGLDPESFEALVPDLDSASRAACELLAWADNRPARAEGDLSVTVSGLPLCALPGYHDRSFDLRRDDLAEVSETFDTAFSRSDFLGRIKAGPCKDCRLSEDCPGVFEEILKIRGEAGLKPEIGPISNSFVFETRETLEDFDPLHCPVKSGRIQLDEAARLLLMQGEDGIQLLRSDTLDFDLPTLQRVKDLGQIYQDVSGRLYHEDFQSDLRKLSPSDGCSDCARPHACPGLWRPVKEEVFSAAEEELEGLISAISGNTLDVGGGPLRFSETFDRLIESGRMDYHVVEPEPGSPLRHFLEKHKLEDRLFKGRMELYRGPAGSFDWILVLRSHNHFYDLDAAYRNIGHLLKPGGRLMLVDNIVYGVVRSREIMERLRLDGGRDRFEHYNNHESREAIPYVEAAGLTLLEQHPVTADSANQWWCLFEKQG